MKKYLLSNPCKKCKQPNEREGYWCEICSLQYRDKRALDYAPTLNKIIELKSVPCLDCKGIFPHWVMQFDHMPGKEKSSNVCKLVQQKKPLHIILEEISKCELVCANCHQNRTYKRKQEDKAKRREIILGNNSPLRVFSSYKKMKSSNER